MSAAHSVRQRTHSDGESGPFGKCPSLANVQVTPLSHYRLSTRIELACSDNRNRFIHVEYPSSQCGYDHREKVAKKLLRSTAGTLIFVRCSANAAHLVTSLQRTIASRLDRNGRCVRRNRRTRGTAVLKAAAAQQPMGLLFPNGPTLPLAARCWLLAAGLIRCDSAILQLLEIIG